MLGESVRRVDHPARADSFANIEQCTDCGVDPVAFAGSVTALNPDDPPIAPEVIVPNEATTVSQGHYRHGASLGRVGGPGAVAGRAERQR